MPAVSDVSVLGTGNMGAAFARSLLHNGFRVTVWNRNASKAESLKPDGARIAATPADAIAASPMSIIAVLDHSATMAILEDTQVAQALLQRDVLQTSSGRPEELRSQHEFVARNGGRYLGGAIFSSPRWIGQPHTVGICAGDSAAFQAHEQTLKSLARFQYLGSDVATAVGIYMTMGTLMMGTMVLFYETAAVGRHFGLSTDSYFSLYRLTCEATLRDISDGAQRIASGHFEKSATSIDLVCNGMPDLMAALQQSGVSVCMAEAMARQIQSARIADGYGKDLSYLTEVLWRTRADP